MNGSNTPDSVLQPLSNILETCVVGPVKMIGKGRCNVEIRNFEEEIDVIMVDQLVNHCLLEPQRVEIKAQEQNKSQDLDDSESKKSIIQYESRNIVGIYISSTSQMTICGHVIEVTTDKGIKQTQTKTFREGKSG
ncbi:unnamed protein product [Brachionus calyciflorus]|uniref:Uncharacterized protein n=1 Tax=Brachionus calyciflorus TaxID=104777 RepID=A0A814LD79_9BILA|nr:unnamed protein product [Brachionus calyciflorus]